MQRAVVILIFCLAAAATAPIRADAADPAVIAMPSFGCQDIELTKRIFKVSVDDEIAALRLISQSIAANACAKFESGTTVLIDDRISALGLKLIQIRIKGDPRQYWTTTDSVR